MKANDAIIISKIKRLRVGAVALLAIGLLKIMRDEYKVPKKELYQVIEEAKKQEEKISKQR